MPWFSTSQKLAIWIAFHVFLAGCGAGFAARACGCSVSMSSLAGIGYGLSCPVFFQHANLVYLAGAAWAGWAIGAIIRSQHALTKSRASGLRFALLFALSTSMMFLAGDPQSAAHAWLIAAAVVLYQACRCTVVLWRGRHSDSSFQKLFGNVKGLGIAVALFVTATAVQLLPARHAAMLTNRSEVEHVYTGLSAPTQDLSRLINDIPDEPHRAFAFSLSPWHVATAAFPLLGGHYQPSNTRWFSLLAAEGRMWVPSIYFGVIPFLAVFGVKRNERRTHLEWWLLGLAGKV